MSMHNNPYAPQRSFGEADQDPPAEDTDYTSLLLVLGESRKWARTLGIIFMIVPLIPIVSTVFEAFTGADAASLAGQVGGNICGVIIYVCFGLLLLWYVRTVDAFLQGPRSQLLEACLHSQRVVWAVLGIGTLVIAVINVLVLVALVIAAAAATLA
jgi:hypothetical protein